MQGFWGFVRIGFPSFLFHWKEGLKREGFVPFVSFLVSFVAGDGGPFGWSPGSFTLNKLECSIQACKGLEYINMG